ncbi:MAG: HD domain-containing protein [Lachnospiraceae bacterium]|nr:HD domain-containing protein [Lachnospiraceae bacterium]
MRYIEELREGMTVSDIYLCKNKVVAKTKMGKTYYSLLLQDKTGTLDAKIWELTNGIENFEQMDYVKVDGQVTSFQGSLQLNVKRLRKASEGQYEPADYIPCTDKDIDEMFKEVIKMINSIGNSYLKQMLIDIFGDKEFAARFKVHSAAKRVHHGFMGGLLEHTLAVTKLCDFYCTQYPVLNRDLLITCALCHDIGKIYELSTFPENDYTDEGQLVGHIVMGTIMLDEKMKKIPGFPVKLSNEVKHCILAHHGELEFGSPKKPSLIEAVALTHADNTDAKIQSFKEALLENKENQEWLGYNRLFENNIRATSKTEGK